MNLQGLDIEHQESPGVLRRLAGILFLTLFLPLVGKGLSVISVLVVSTVGLPVKPMSTLSWGVFLGLALVMDYLVNDRPVEIRFPE